MGCGTAHSVEGRLENLQRKCKEDRERIDELEKRITDLETMLITQLAQF